MKSKKVFRNLFSNWPVKILALAGAVVLFFLNNINRMEERYLSVPLDIIVNDNYVLSTRHTERIRVRLRGDEDGIFQIFEEDLYAGVDFSEYKSEGIFKAPVEIDLTGNAETVEPLEIQVEPKNITLELEEKIQKSLEVVPNITGNPAPGYNLVRYYLNPSAVEANGPRSRVMNIQQVKTEEIDLTGRNDDFSVRVRIISPNEFISFPGGNVVEFQGIIEEKVVVQEISSVDIAILDLEPGLRIADPVPNGFIQLQGGQRAMNRFSMDEILLTVDASDAEEPGTYTLQVSPIVPDDLSVLDFEPREIELTVELREEAE